MTQASPARPVNRAGEEENHVFCPCDETTALCGVDVTGHAMCVRGDHPVTCVVCADLDDKPCARCGR